MIQKSYYSNYKKKTPYKFIPRRDLFPDVDLPPVSITSPAKSLTNKTSSYKASGKIAEKHHTPQKKGAGVHPVHTGNKAQSKTAQPLVMHQPLHPVRRQSSLSINPTTLFLLLAGWFLLWPAFKKSRPKLAANLQSTVANVLDNPNSTQMLLAIGPYLEDNEQDAVYTITGILEAANILRDVMNHSYHDRNRSMILSVPSSPAARRLELMKSIRPYIPQHNRKNIDAIIGIYDTVYKLNRNYKIYQNNRTLSEDKKVTPIDSIGEILNVVSPVLPQEHRAKAEKVMQVLKMAEIVGSTTNTTRKNDKNEHATKAEMRTNKSDGSSEKQTNANEQIQKVMDSFLPMMNDEQKESMNMIMKMAQLLAQPDDSSDSDDEN
jgi:hypothetical protein